jgi:hypothetical protein
MTGQIDEHLNKIKEACESCITATLKDQRAMLGEVHLLDEDIARWLSKLTGPERDQIKAARRELAIAEFAIACGLYRQAFSSLRLFLELSFAAVHFSVNEFERRRWSSDRMDFSWSSALDENEGVLSRKFVVEFSPSLQDDARTYASSAASCYRYCSQFVHGKARVSEALPDTIQYSAQVVQDWCDRAKQGGEAVIFLLLIRYGVEFDALADTSLSEIITNRYGHLTAVRKLLGLAGEQ